MTIGIVEVEVPESVLIVEGQETVLVIEEHTELVEVASGGAQGAKGDQGGTGGTGPTGPQGPPGVPGAGFNYIHDQAIAAATWTIVHNLGGFPNVTTIDSSGREVEGSITYVDANTITVEFSVAFGGKAYLS